SLASLAAAGIFAGGKAAGLGRPFLIATALGAVLAYSVVSSGLIGLGSGIEERTSPLGIWREELARLLPHYAMAGLVGGVLAAAYSEMGLPAFGAAIVPLLLVRKTHAAHLRRSELSS